MNRNPATTEGEIRVHDHDKWTMVIDWLPGTPGYAGILDEPKSFRESEEGVGGYLVVSWSGNNLQVEYIEVDEDFQRKGVATRLYQEAQRLARERGGTLVSDSRLEREARLFWEKMRKAGLAERMVEGSRSYYVMKPKASVLPNPTPEEATVEIRWPSRFGRPGVVRLNVLEDGFTTTIATANLRVGQYDVQVQEAEVAEDYQGQGYGRRLYMEVFREAARHGLAVESDWKRSEGSEAIWRRFAELGFAEGHGSGGTRLVPKSGYAFRFRESGSWPFLFWRVEDPGALVSLTPNVRDPNTGLEVEPVGECFAWATKEAMDHGGTVVHGVVTQPFSQPPQRYEHAWVERDGMVYDWQTMEAGHGGKYGGQGYPVVTFYDLYEPKNTVRYEPEEAIKLMVSEGHWGPWDPSVDRQFLK